VMVMSWLENADPSEPLPTTVSVNVMGTA